MPLVPDYIPTYIKQQINASPKQVITAERWNELFNLVITQGDNTTDDVVALLTALAATTAASNIGADVPSVVGKTVQEILNAFETAIAERYTKTESNALVATNTNDLVKSITFNDQDGKFTITKKDGAIVVIDTVLEKVPVSMVFETVGGVTRIRLTNQDGTTSTADVSALVDNYTFSNTDTIALSTTGVGNQKNISATLRDGSVTLPKLSLDTVTQLQGYRDAAANSATAAAASVTTAAGHKDAAAASAAAALVSKNAAATSAGEALTSKNTAASSMSSAADSANTAGTQAINATNKANEAATSAVASQSWAVGGTGTRSGENTNNAKYYAENAAAIVGQKVATFNGRDGVVVPQAGDYTAAMVEATPAAHETDATKHVGTDTKTTPINADSVALVDSADSSKVKQLTWANLKTALTSVFANKSHAAPTTTHGQATGTNFGHAKLSDETNSTSGVASGIAATPAAVKAAYDSAAAAVPNTRTINGKPLSSNITLTASDVGAATAADVQAASSDSLIRDFKIMMNLALGTSNMDAVADLLADAARINAGASSGYAVTGGKLTKGTASESIVVDTTGTQTISFGYLWQPKAGQTFVPQTGGKISSLIAVMKLDAASPTMSDGVVCKIYDMVGGYPTNLIATSDIVTGITTTQATKTFSFTSLDVNLKPGVVYALVFERTGEFNGNGYSVLCSSSSTYANGIALTFTTVWNSNTTQDIRTTITITAPTTANVVWNSIDTTAPLDYVAVSAIQTLGPGSVTYYVSQDGVTWVQILALDTAQAVNFTDNKLYLKAVITGNAAVDAVAWGGF